ncbi:carbohydrate ABC transporter permease [Humibacter antri]
MSAPDDAIPRASRTRLPRRRRGWLSRRALLYLLLSVVGLVFVMPFVILLSTALKPSTQALYTTPPNIVPWPPVLTAFAAAWTTVPLVLYFLNSVLLVVITVVPYLVVSALTAYPLARITFRGRGVFFIMFLSTMFLPGELLLIPRYLVLSQLGLTNTFIGVALPGILSALGIFLLRQSFAQIPNEVVEAARLDGCSEWRIFWNVCLPLVRPTIAVLTILGFISVWNSFIWPLVVLTSPTKYPLSLGIAYLAGFAGNDDRTLAAGTVMSLIPIVIVFLTMQRHIMVSLAGAVKG